MPLWEGSHVAAHVMLTLPIPSFTEVKQSPLTSSEMRSEVLQK